MNKAGFLSDENKTNLNQHDFYDRIINVKIVAGKDDEAETEYVIRSDYEVVYEQYNYENLFSTETFSPNRYRIRRCVHKPSIKVQYKMVSAETGTEIDLYLTNFFMLTSDGRQLRNFTKNDLPITRVEIAMGYWGQFRHSDFTLSTWKIDDLFNISSSGRGADVVVVRDLIVVTTDKLPPDSVIHLHGYVANISDSAVSSSVVSNSTQAEMNAVASSSPLGKKSPMESLLYKEITKRFLKEKIVNRGDKAKSLADTKGILNHKPAIDPVSGLMVDAEADIYGVRIITSDGVDALPINQLKGSDGTPVENNAYFEAGDSIGKTMNKIRSCINNDLCYRFLDDGNMLVFLLDETKEENIHELGKTYERKGAYAETALAKVYSNKIPAVYNINIDAISTIVCPFFAFVNPFQTIEFATRYALTNNVAYLADYDTSLYKFRTLKVSVSFATVEDVNEMQIMAVSVKDAKKEGKQDEQ